MASQASRPSERGLRLLSIDGGGIRGLSPMLMLKEIMYRIQQDNHLKELPRPCDVFDLAGGTSTGGLIVIMLFRLQMSIDEAIDAYVKLARTVFSEKKWFFQEGTFKASRLEDAIVSIIRSRLLEADGDPREAKMLNEDGPKCFVCAMLARDMSFPTLFRSWVPPTNPPFDCTIIQAARATTAAPAFFKAIEFGHPTTQRYLDGGLRCNNPVRYVVDEARSLYNNRHISCVLSLGTGTTGVIGLERPDAFQNMLPTSLVRVLKSIAMDCEEQSEVTARQLRQHDPPNSYFRLNVNSGLQNVSLAEWSRMDDVEAHTVQYLKTNDVGEKVDRVVERLKGEEVDRVVELLTGEVVDQAVEPLKAEDPASKIVSNLPPKGLPVDLNKAFEDLKKAISQNAFYDSQARSASTGCLPGTRRDEIETITKWIETGSKEKPFLVVLGPAGSGKTSLLHTVAQIFKARGVDTGGFFFSGTDTERNNEARFITTIAYQIAVAIPELQPYITRTIAADSTILSRALDSQLKSLLLEPLHQLRSDYPDFSIRCEAFVIVVDALDECGKLENQCRVLAVLSEALSNAFIPVFCLLSSRFSPHIEHEVSTTLESRIHDRVVLGTNGVAEKDDIRKYLHASVDRIRKRHAFGSRLPGGWPAESDLETIVDKSGGQFIYASTVIRYVESPEDNPHERLRYILGISNTKSGEDPFAELDALYRVLMSSVKNLAVVIEILGIKLVHSSSQFWTPASLIAELDFEPHFQALDAEIFLAPLAPVLKCDSGRIEFYHLSFSEFLLEPARSGEYFVQPTKWQRWIVARLVPFFYDKQWIELDDVKYLLEAAKPGTDLHQAIDDGLALVSNHPKLLPSGGEFNIWPFVTEAFFRVLSCFNLTIDQITDVFIHRPKGFLPFPVFLKFSLTTNLSNSFLSFEFCRFCKELELNFLGRPLHVSLYSNFTTYLSDYVEKQKVLLPDDYNSASLRSLWYLQTPSCDVRTSLLQQFHSYGYCFPMTFGIFSFYEDTSTNVARGALETLPLLLPHAPPSTELLAALKQPFDTEVLSRTPASSNKALHIIHNYLMQHDPEYQQGEYTVLSGLTESGDNKPRETFESLLRREPINKPV